MSAIFATKETAAQCEVLPALRENRVLILIIAIYAVAAVVLTWQLDLVHDAAPLLSELGTAELTGPLFALCGYAIYVMFIIRPPRLTRFLITSVRQYMTRARILHALPVFVLFPVFVVSFTIFKAALPVIRPYAWDSRFAQWDLTLHGGTHPWEWLQWMVSHPAFTALINFSYHLWFFIMIAMFYWLALTMDRPKLRAQFLLSFLISWILLGTVVATFFSSVGPCYYGLILPGHDPYAPLMAYLRQTNGIVPVWALDVQKMLWDGYRGNAGSHAMGISAMPSMHVATSTLLALAGWRLSRQAGIALTLFALVIMVGSVHLGWHYAVDGYVGAAGAFVIWRVVGWCLAERQNAHQTILPIASWQTTKLP